MSLILAHRKAISQEVGRVRDRPDRPSEDVAQPVCSQEVAPLGWNTLTLVESRAVFGLPGPPKGVLDTTF